MSVPSSERVPITRPVADRAAQVEFRDLYGFWNPLSLSDVAAELGAFDRPWWVVGGWAIEAVTGVHREHEDLDVSILSSDVPAFVDHLRGRWHVWNNVGGVLHPLGGRWPDVDDPASQLWLRRNASSPWVLDVPLTPVGHGGLWVDKYVDGHVAPVEAVTWVDENRVRYLLPEIVLVAKARLRRTKDDPDFDAALPILDQQARAWMRAAITALVPDHPWLRRL